MVIEVPSRTRARRLRRLLAICVLVAAGSAMAQPADAAGAQATIVAGPADGADVGDRTPTFEFIAASSSVVSICTIDAGLPFICTSPLTLIALKDGRHTLSVGGVALTDALARPAVRSFTVDTVAPDTEITSGPSDGSRVRDDKLRFGWTSRDAVGFDCRLDGRPASSCDGALSKPIAKGPHTFSIAAFDAAGNVDPTPARRGFVVVSSLTGPPGCRVGARSILDSDHRGVVTGSAAPDILLGRGGDDVLRGLGGRDCLYGGAGSDTLVGGSGDDLLSGGLGADRLIDGRGRDTFLGGVGNDVIDARDRTTAGARRADAVDCGRGFDRALVDRADRVARSCERVLVRKRR